MDTQGFVEVDFGSPINITATVPTKVTWHPDIEFPSDENVPINIWLVRHDDPTNAQILTYPLELIAGNVPNNGSIQWTPLSSDTDHGPNVSHTGNHQMAMERYAKNTSLDPLASHLEAFSPGFWIRSPSDTYTNATVPPPSSASSSSISSASSSTESSTDTSLVLGLSISLGFLALASLAFGSWFLFFRKEGSKRMRLFSKGHAPMRPPSPTYDKSMSKGLDRTPWRRTPQEMLAVQDDVHEMDGRAGQHTVRF